MRFVLVVLTLMTIVGWSEADEVKLDVTNRYINRKRIKNINGVRDEDAKVCSDFYQYACGKWSEKYDEINSHYTSAFDMIKYDVDMESISYLENIRMVNKPNFVKQAHDLYASCRSTLGEFDGIQWLQWIQKQHQLNIALLSTSDDEEVEYDWVRSLSVFRRYSLHNVFIDEWMLRKPEDSSKNIVYLLKPESTKLTENDMDYLKEFTKLPENAEKSYDEIYEEYTEFEGNLTEILNAEYEDQYENTMPLTELPMSNVFLKYLDIALNNTLCENTDEVTMAYRGYFEALDELLQQYDDKFLSRYLEIKWLLSLKEFKIQGTDIECIQMTRDLLPLSMDWIYMELHPELMEEIPKVKEMFNLSLEQVKKTLSSGKKSAIPEGFVEKLDKVQLKIGYMPLIDSTAVLESAYANLTLNSTDYYGNVLNIFEMYFKFLHTKMENPERIDVNTFFEILDNHDDGTDFLPYYNSEYNIVISPFYILTEPVYHWGYEDLFKYSFLGSYLIYPIYKELATLNDFSDVEVERIADLGSIHTMFDLYFSADHNDVQENYSLSDQELKKLFFLNTAQMFCAKDITAYDQNHFNFIVSHMPEFADTFDCTF